MVTKLLIKQRAQNLSCGESEEKRTKCQCGEDVAEMDVREHRRAEVGCGIVMFTSAY